MPWRSGWWGGSFEGCIIAACTALAFAIFWFDLVTPADNVSIGFAYDSVIFLTALLRNRKLYFPFAAASSILVAVGCFFPLPGWDEAPVFFANRTLSVMSLWLIAFVIHYRSEAEAALIRLLETSDLASQSKTRFLATMSHELRAPLTGILGFSEILKSEMLGPMGNRRYVEYSNYIHESGEHMLSLINDVLDIAKIEAGRLEIEPERVPVSTLLDYVADFSAARISEKDLTLTVNCPQTLPLYADVRAVKQMALNLLSNAIKFTPPSGTITVTATQVPDGGVTLAFHDTGIGMSYETISRLMRPFEQADNRFGIAEKGTGLGLSLVKGLVELHGGHLAIDSRVGQGSTFTLHFPPPPSPPPPSPPAGTGGPTARAAEPGPAGTK